MSRIARSMEGRPTIRLIVAVAVTGGLIASMLTFSAAAQTIPYESSRRSTVGRGLGQGALPQGTVFEPRIEAAVQYASNINLAEDGEPQVDTAGVEVAPGFYASVSGGSLVGAIDYSIVGRAWEDSEYNDVAHRLSANAQWMAVPEWFAVRGDARYSDSVIDPRNGLNYGGLGIFGSGNLQETAAASINPVLQHQFNNFEVSADYRYGRVWYLDEGKGVETPTISDRESEDESANARIGTASDRGRLSGSLFYNWQKTQQDDVFLPYEFERAGLSATIQLSRTVSLVGDVGKESDLSKRAASGGLDADFWNAGLRWTPNDRTELEARYGDRSYGEYYSASLAHRARLLEFTASYSEQPTVETRRLSLGDIFPGELPPGVPDVDLGIFNSLPYIYRNANATVAAQGSRTELSLSAFWYERDYLASEREEDESGVGAGFNVSRRLASNLSAAFDVSYREYERMPTLDAVAPSDERDTQARLSLDRESGEKLTLGAEAGYLTRTGDRDYDGWWIAMRARWTP